MPLKVLTRGREYYFSPALSRCENGSTRCEPLTNPTRDEGSAMSICPIPAEADRQGLQAAVLRQDSACHRRFRTEASDRNFGFRGARYTLAQKSRRWSRAKAKWEMSAEKRKSP